MLIPTHTWREAFQQQLVWHPWAMLWLMVIATSCRPDVGCMCVDNETASVFSTTPRYFFAMDDAFFFTVA